MQPFEESKRPASQAGSGSRRQKTPLEVEIEEKERRILRNKAGYEVSPCDVIGSGINGDAFGPVNTPETGE